jgi:hypothetical protein
MPYNDTAERKIYFYRVVPQDPSKAPSDWTLNRKAVTNCIESLTGKPEFYFEEDGGERITCAEVHGDRAPQKLKFYAIRRTDLPSLDSGTGVIGDLALAETEGLAEAVHLRLFPNSIIGFESFFYGPRISRIEAFLNERCAAALGVPVFIKQLYRGDMITRALKYEDIRVFHAKIHPSNESRRAAQEAGLKGVMDTASEFGADVYAEIRLRADPGDARFTNRVKGLLRTWRDSAENPSDFLVAADIAGKNPETDKVEPLNVLNDALVRVAFIERQSARSRALDTDAAFEAVWQAYRQVKALLPSDALEA